MPSSGDPALRQSPFDWKITDKYQGLCSVEIEIKNIFMTNNYYTGK